MPTLSIKNVPDELLGRLRERAALHHRSIQGELMALLAAALGPRMGAASSATKEAPAMRPGGTRRIEEIAAEHRQRWKKPFSRVPQAVDLIRADRNAR
jgi:plasmid stability protein